VKDFVDLNGRCCGWHRRRRQKIEVALQLLQYVYCTREKEREFTVTSGFVACNGYRTIQIAQFKLKENEQENNKWILYIDSVDIAIQ